ncbi:MAG: tRNA 4-thiouridine(8) synthase ThiI [Nitrospirae bacterium]|nr:tRNA 4-thiouridine(8) synthase ThiI [Nitrospirota bacterium]
MTEETQTILVHYHEIALKGKNRPVFLEQLAQNLKAAVSDLGKARVRRMTGRLQFQLDGTVSWETLRKRLGMVFGVANFLPAYRVEPSIEAMQEAIGRSVAGRTFESFRVTAKRADKTFPLTSPEINRQVGGYVKAQTGVRVDLENPELTIYLEVLPGEAFFAFERYPGPGGLPVGVSGRVVALLSGGIDSPVASYRMMKRGCRVLFVHFHGQPYLSRASAEKAEELANLLTRYQYRSRLYLVPFGEVQREVVLGVPAPYRVVLYRRLMIRIAEKIAAQERAKALVTGDSLGQVASQTLENLAVVGQSASGGLALFRPLIGMDKDEITAQAQAIGTYEISIQPDQDCCQLFIPKRPATRTTVEVIERVEERLGVERLVKMALEKIEVKEFRFPGGIEDRG